MSARMKTGILICTLFLIGALAAWIYQIKEGLVLTHMQNAYSWGLYISGLAFFVGNAAGGLVISASIYLFGVKKLKPLAKLGALTALANVTAAMLIVLPDIGQPLRLYYMLLHPNFMSPLVWDIIVLSLYTLLSAVYLYVLMLPDLTGKLAFLSIKVADPAAFSEKWAKRIAPVALLFAIGIHVITAWIFSTQGAREWWHSPAMAPDFVAVAIAVGSTVVLLAGALAYGTAPKYQEAYRTLGLIIFIAVCVHLFLMINDLVIHAWYGTSETRRIIDITLGRFTAAHLFEVIAPLAGAILLMLPSVLGSPARITAGAVLLIAGVFVHRYLIMPAAYNDVPLTLTPLGLPDVHWSMPIATGRLLPDTSTFVDQYAYSPSLIEITILSGIVGYAILLILLAIRHLPILSREAA